MGGFVSVIKKGRTVRQGLWRRTFLGWGGRLALAGALALGGAAAGEGHAEPIAVWDAFLTALRAGRMQDAYACVAPEVRRRLNYRDFCVAWHPLTRNYQAVLQPPVFSEFCIAGDVATLRLGVRESAGRGGGCMQAFLVRDDEGWWMAAVDPKIAAPVVAEADGRGFLRQLWRQSALARAALLRGAAVTLEQLRQENPVLFARESTRRVLDHYELEIANLRDGVLRLRPRRPGARCLELDAHDHLTVREAAPARARTTDEAARAAAARAAAVRQGEIAAQENAAREREAAKAAKAAAEIARARELAAHPELAPAAPDLSGLPELPPDFGNPDAVASAPAPAPRPALAGDPVSPAPATLGAGAQGGASPKAPAAPALSMSDVGGEIGGEALGAVAAIAGEGGPVAADDGLITLPDIFAPPTGEPLPPLVVPGEAPKLSGAPAAPKAERKPAPKAIAKVADAGAAARDAEPLMPEFDEPEMLMAPPAGAAGGAVPPAGVTLRR